MAWIILASPVLPAQEAGVHDVPVWIEGSASGGWGNPRNADIVRDAEGLVLKAGNETYYGACFRDLGEIDLDKLPFFAVEVDKAEGGFGAKLTNTGANDKQVIFQTARKDGAFVTDVPAQTGWKGKVRLVLGVYCHGADKSLRVKRIQFVGQPTADILMNFIQTRNLVSDASFESSETGKLPLQVWHRIGSYLADDTPWRVVEGGAFEGQKCVRAEQPGRLVLQREIHGPGSGMYTFSAYLRAARAGHRAKLLLTTYRQGKPWTAEPREQEIQVGTEWTRYSMTADVPSVRNRALLGAVDLGVESLEVGALWADAVQLEHGAKPILFGRNDTLIVYKPLENLRSSLYPPVEDPAAPARMPKEEPGRLEMLVMSSDERVPDGFPMAGAVPLPQGKTWDARTWRLTAREGQTLPLQVNVLSRWKGDGSVKSAQVISEASGSREYLLEYGKADSPKGGESMLKVDEVEGGLRVSSPSVSFSVDTRNFRGPEFGETGRGSGFSVTSFDGGMFSSAAGKVASVRVEEKGPVRAVVRVEGDHRSEKGGHLLSYVARIYAFRSKPLVRVEYTWINTNSSPSIAVAGIAWQVGLDGVRRASFVGAEGKPHEVDISGGPAMMMQVNADKKYSYEVLSGSKRDRYDGKAEGRARLQLARGAVAAQMEDFWRNHPMAIGVAGDSATFHFWPSKVKGAELTRGMSKTYIVDLWFGADVAAAGNDISPLVLRPKSAAYCVSGVFGGEVLPSEGSPFVLYEKAAASAGCLGHMDPEYLATYDVFGQFNYGDTLGDGGWGNMETQLDHAMWVHFIRTGNPVYFKIAQAAARHYRDIDVDHMSGATHTHNPSHTLGGRSTSHAWIQGTLDHYMATGEKRSMEVAQLHADFLKNLPLSELTSGGREVTRALDNFADIYGVTGDEALLGRYDEICAFQRDNIAKGKSGFPGLFQHFDRESWVYPANFVPWYGLYSLVKLDLATGNPKWRKLLLDEMTHALDVGPFKYSRPEYFEGNRLSDDERIVRCLAEGAIGDRGNMLFPALGYAYRWSRNPRYLDIGMSTVYIALISGEYRDPLYGLAAVFLEQARQAGMGAADEERYYRKAIDIMQRAAHPALANPGFEEGTKCWAAWRVKSTTSAFWVPVRKGCLLMDRQNRKEGAQSLRVVLTRQNPPSGFGVPLDSDDFALQEGKTHRIEGWLREQGDVKATVGLRVRPLSFEVAPFSCTSTISDPEADGWRRWSIEAKIETPSLAQVTFSVSRKTVTSEGEAWLDGISIK